MVLEIDLPQQVDWLKKNSEREKLLAYLKISKQDV
jgi:hypothetical protein